MNTATNHPHTTPGRRRVPAVIALAMAAGVALAAALPDLPYACGLATVQLLTDDVVKQPLLPVDGLLPVTRPDVDTVAVTRLAAPADRVAHWQTRLRDVGQDQSS